MTDCMKTMLALGECVDKARSRGMQETELELCSYVANGIYILCMYAKHILRMNSGALPDAETEKFDAGMTALRQMLEMYRDTDDSAILENTVKAIRCTYNYQEAKRVLSKALNKQIQG